MKAIMKFDPIRIEIEAESFMEEADLTAFARLTLRGGKPVVVASGADGGEASLEKACWVHSLTLAMKAPVTI